MLVRSSSTSTLSSLVRTTSGEIPPELDRRRAPRSPSTSSFSPLTQHEPPINKMRRVPSETDLRDVSVQKRKSSPLGLQGMVKAGERTGNSKRNSSLLSVGRLFSRIDLNEMEIDDAGGFGNDGGRSNNGDGFSGSWNSNAENDKIEAYYKNMIKDNPGNALLIGNYARFLKEVRGDNINAEEYCERSILANPSDGNVISLYADLMWESYRDSSRAEKYFNQAVQAAPDDCYVMASYAKFLWDAEEEEADWEIPIRPPDSLRGTSPHMTFA